MNPTAEELEAQADELEAAEIIRAATADAEILRLRARAKRLRVERSIVTKASEHMTRSEYAISRRMSEATVSRLIAAGMPTLPVGTTHRIDPVAADAWRQSRPRVATTPAKKVAANDDADLDVSGSLSAAGMKRTSRP